MCHESANYVHVLAYLFYSIGPSIAGTSHGSCHRIWGLWDSQRCFRYGLSFLHLLRVAFGNDIGVKSSCCNFVISSISPYSLGTCAAAFFFNNSAISNIFSAVANSYQWSHSLAKIATMLNITIYYTIDVMVAFDVRATMDDTTDWWASYFLEIGVLCRGESRMRIYFGWFCYLICIVFVLLMGWLWG